MFVKKDLRKIPEIFAGAVDSSQEDASKSITELRLARRHAEFNGSIAPLCQPQFRPTLQKLTSLSLYDCQISNLQNFEFLSEACPLLEEINLGRNPLTSLPEPLGQMKSLKAIWLDDCEIDGLIPTCLYQLDKLQSLRMSNNKITSLMASECDSLEGIWPNMQVLCLDGNMIEIIPEQLVCLTNLKILMLRNNKIKSLPYGVPGRTHASLQIFQISSNELTALPPSIAECPCLEKIYANANMIADIPLGLSKMMSLKHCNLSNNNIVELGYEFVERFGKPDVKDGKCTKDTSVEMLLEQNPVVKQINVENESTSMEVD
mmetsp:Transcript_7961/g.14991  ORF Transcript_7961/g.14991 Transcript_7961/m.14991 type:complete len:318 (-) Transcript_7961:152-1105(-)|eukprot:CAMPEP_0176490920 /NCGR_PEP_ID=MMETSP0200_2-20121128/8142_1 /TAXON_ID=947934 /ORGANISM="Chaetoceros sp., Strain GSL56" /LENGTH=317 /DNA_ID=CAMNT_0017888287 /DNA_START=200 /DNA_END=1153 /DNA_ORIENTATION=-